MTAFELARWLIGCDDGAEVRVVTQKPSANCDVPITDLLYKMGDDDHDPVIFIVAPPEKKEEAPTAAPTDQERRT
jgi:hypothetical protein